MTHSDKAPTAEQLARARRIYADYGAAKALEAGDMVDAAWKAAVLDGDADKSHGVRIALAAIIETTRLASEMADQWRDENRANCKDALMDRAAIEMNAFAGSLRNNDHLKGQSHD